jgi:hypothetical protein
VSVQLDPEWERFSARLRAFPANLEANMRQTMQASLLMVERDARRNAPQDTRRLAGSITNEIRGSGLALEGRVGPSVRYGAPVEFGAHFPGKGPPPQALVGWVRRHWGAGLPGRGAARERALLSRARYLSRLIKQRGLRARPYLRPAYESNRTAITALFARMGVRVTAQLAGGGQGGQPL